MTFRYLVMGVVGNWLHNTFHIKGHFLERYAWFGELRALHYIHHLGTCKHNYAVLNFGVLSPDKMFGSVLLQKPSRKTEKNDLDTIVSALPEGIDAGFVVRGTSY
jgi:hypothetical protein